LFYFKTIGLLKTSYKRNDEKLKFRKTEQKKKKNFF